MDQVLLVTQKKDDFKEFSERLKEKDLMISWTETGEEALSSITKNNILMVVVDENLPDMTGLAFVEKLIVKNPMIYCAAVSSLSESDYHEASEGFGILMQLPLRPQKKHAEELYLHLEKILNISKPRTC
jgi:DNA-binding NtrC family response regulator